MLGGELHQHSSMRYCMEEDDRDYYGDIWLTPLYMESDFPTGYLSFYKMKNEDFEKAENINMQIKKFMRYS